ncbi:MAG: hypothetical protein H6819_02560 [Phycisphaerales bacterium]|nr:hypothetical protein [Phycisphaerales bacterium]MCB9856905.1 hypothetical protein [Phycisphaerales bacterium]MCB9861968.1 hypothetical protein [Phycisphaerales bacterium]
MYRNKIVCLLMITAFVSTTGCSWAARRTLREAKGASAEITPIGGANPSNFRNFAGVQAAAPRTRLGNLVPGEFISSFAPACQKCLVDGKEAPLAGSGQPVQIDSEVMWYHKRQGLGVVTGEKSYAVMLLDLSGAGRNLGRVQIVASSGASRTDAADMAEAMAEELADWIRGREKKKD